MIPTLFHIGPFRVHAYGVMLVISFVLGTWWATKAAARRGLDPERIFSLAGWILVSSIAGSRLHFVLAHPGSFGSPLDIFRIWEGGLTLYGGLMAAIIVSLLYLRRHRVSFLSVADATAPALALGEGTTRIGCFLNGCCFGRPCSGALCVHYPADSYAAQALGEGCVYPAQLFLSAAMLLVFVILWRLDRRTFRPGILFGLYLIGQGIVRFFVDFYRYYEQADRLPALAPVIQTKSQLVALLLLIGGGLLVINRLAAARRAVAKAEG